MSEELLESFIEKLTRPIRDNLHYPSDIRKLDENLIRLDRDINRKNPWMYRRALENISSDQLFLNNTGELTISEMLNVRQDDPINIERLMNTMYYMNKELTENGYQRTTLYDALITLRYISRGGFSSTTYIARYMDKISMIMKVKSEDENHQLHEYLVGTEINKLLKDIPNFPRTYGFSKETNPFFDSISDTDIYYGYAVGKPRNKHDVQVYIQYFENSVDLRYIDHRYTADAIDSSGNKVTLQGYSLFQMIFLQLFSALLYAYTEIGFVHRDLTLGNILLVNLDDIKAIPVMVPIYQEGSVRYEKRWIWSNLLVVIIDFGSSSVNNEEFYERYETKAISPLNNRIIYEDRIGMEDELISIIPHIFRKFKLTEFKELNDIFFNLLEDMDSPEDLDQERLYEDILKEHGSLEDYKTHPDITYYTYKTVSKYCRKYSDIWTHPSPGDYPSVIQKDTSIDIKDITIRDSRQYYLLNISGELNNFRIDLPSVLRNLWYRNEYTNVTAELYGNDKYDHVIEVSFVRYYKWLISTGLDLNMSPYKYQKPLDFLIESYKIAYPSKSSTSMSELREYANLGYTSLD